MTADQYPIGASTLFDSLPIGSPTTCRLSQRRAALLGSVAFPRWREELRSVEEEHRRLGAALEQESKAAVEEWKKSSEQGRSGCVWLGAGVFTFLWLVKGDAVLGLMVGGAIAALGVVLVQVVHHLVQPQPTIRTTGIKQREPVGSL